MLVAATLALIGQDRPEFTRVRQWLSGDIACEPITGSRRTTPPRAHAEIADLIGADELRDGVPEPAIR